MAGLVGTPGTLAKFRTDGVSKVHPGSTFVAAVREGSALQEVGERIQSDARSRGWESDFAFTVPSSFHMTVLEGPEANGTLPTWLEDANDFPEAVVRMRQRLAEARIAAPTRLEMKTTGVFDLHERLTFKLVPADDEVNAELDRFRKQAGAVLEIPVKELSEYHFHSTLGYRLTVAEPDEPALLEAKALYDSWAAEVTSVDLERVGFCIFNDMQSFPPLLYFDPA
ncbi:hypothetical protein CAPI_01925 [Corynebacterium capitovis DSM 44611]|uniref:DUF1868 domain-containing protein n=1 Tax=Corynebacterium capitovis TaxID=131081 RepID=UPI00036DDCA7|nr:DUF1868 domain-containing protein [Corynebacterium capitovis]WKD56959.1 hypothetical protein CAPI_01925 [Corynebacterium capitovis DSM 44611]